MSQRPWDATPVSNSSFVKAVGDYPTLTPYQKERARSYVASKAQSAEDCQTLLEMLGLLSEEEEVA